jgi:hypothetical protein
MSSTPVTAVSRATTEGKVLFDRHVKPHLTPFNFSIAAVIALVTGGFATLIVIVLLVATNFNLLGAIE